MGEEGCWLRCEAGQAGVVQRNGAVVRSTSPHQHIKIRSEGKGEMLELEQQRAQPV